MTTYSVIIGSPPGGSTLHRGAFGSFGWLTKDSTPAARLNMAFKFGKAGRASKSGCMNARYSISARLPASGQVRISRSGSCSPNVSRHAEASPICLARSTISNAMTGPLGCAIVGVAEIRSFSYFSSTAGDRHVTDPTVNASRHSVDATFSARAAALSQSYGNANNSAPHWTMPPRPACRVRIAYRACGERNSSENASLLSGDTGHPTVPGFRISGPPGIWVTDWRWL